MTKLSDHFNSALSHNDFRSIWSSLFHASPKRGFGLAFLLTSLPSALPVPAPGYSTPFGILILLLTLQMLSGQNSPWMPEWALKKQLSPSVTEAIKKFSTRIFQLSEIFIKPRLNFLNGKPLMWLAGVTIASMALLMIIPIPGTNTLPAMIVFATGLALAEEDGVLLIASIVGGLIAAALYFALLFVIFKFGVSSLQEAWRLLIS